MMTAQSGHEQSNKLGAVAERSLGKKLKLTPSQIEALSFFVQNPVHVEIPLRLKKGSHSRMCTKLVEQGLLSSTHNRAVTPFGLAILQSAICARSAKNIAFREGGVERRRTDINLMDQISQMLELSY